MKKFVASFLLLIMIFVMAEGYLLPANARDEMTETQISLFMKALRQVEAKAEPKDDADTIFAYGEGDYIYVTGETPNGWYIVYYRGQTGYISKNVSQGAEVLQDDQDEQSEQNVQAVFEAEALDLEALDDEMAAQEVENKLIAEGVERYLAEARRSRVWGTAIVLLVIGIFAVGIVSTVRTEKRNKEESEIIDLDKESDEE